MRYIEEGTSRVGEGIEAGLWRFFGETIHFEFEKPEYMESPFYMKFSKLAAKRGWVHHNDSLDWDRHPTFGMIWEKGRGLKQLARASLETSGFYPNWAVVAGAYKFPDVIDVYEYPDMKKGDFYDLPDQGLYLSFVHPEKKDEVIDFGLELMDECFNLDRVLLRIRHSGKFIQISSDGAGHNIIDVFASEMEDDLGIPMVPRGPFGYRGWRTY